MKLELKHLAAYLPYKLRYRDTYAGDVSDYLLTANSLSNWDAGHVKPFLPVLRPLSDLKIVKVQIGEYFCTFSPI